MFFQIFRQNLQRLFEIIYLQDEHIEKIIQISNQMDSCFETWFLVKNIMLAFENTNY